jgi:hypothetical protein
MKKLLIFGSVAAGLAVVFGVFLVSGHIGYEYTLQPEKAEAQTSSYMTEACRQKTLKAKNESASVQQQIDTLDKEINDITAHAALSMPVGYYPDIPEKYLGKAQYVHLHDLYEQHVALQDKIDLTTQKYQCLP